MIAVAEDLDAVGPLLRRLAAHRRAVVPLVELPRVLGMPEEAAVEALCRLQDEALVELWPDCPSGPAACLSGLAVARLGLVMTSSDRGAPSNGKIAASMRWVEPGRDAPEAAVLPLLGDLPGLRDLDVGDLADQLPDPGTVARPSSFEIRIIRDPGFRLRGHDLPCWTPAVESDEPCPVCRGAEFTPRELCLGCLRSGFDEARRAAPPPPAAVARPEETSGSLAGGIGGAPRAKPAKSPRESVPRPAKSAWMAEMKAWRSARGRRR